VKFKFKKLFKRLFKKENVILFVIVVFFVISFVRDASILDEIKSIDDKNSSLISEMGDVKTSYSAMNSSINEIQKYLRLPVSNDIFMNSEDEEADEEVSDNKNTNQLELAMFKYVDYLSVQSSIQEKFDNNRNFLVSLSESESFLNFLTDGNLSVSAVEDFDNAAHLSVSDDVENIIVTYIVNSETGELSLSSAISVEEDLEFVSFASFESDQIKFIKENKTKILGRIAKLNEINASLYEILDSEAFVALLEEKSISRDALNFSNPAGDLIAQINIDSVNVSLILTDSVNLDNSTSVSDVVELETSLNNFVKDLDASTFVQKKSEEALASVEKTVLDSGFQSILDQTNLKISKEYREDDERFYFDIYNLEGNVLSMIVVEKATGVVNITDPDGSNGQNLLFFDPEFKKKTLNLPDVIPDYADNSLDDDGFNILIAGKHGSLVDTMIFTHIDENTQSIKMISVPRDLYYNGRKINAFASSYGMDELKKALSSLTGYELDKYVLIDMYAFIDVVDLIGGVDITLDSAVVDPTYRVVDDGVEGTLNYQPGDYHLGGVEALRLARTRHTSSDFARASRQQMILKAIQHKAQNFGFGDIDTLYSIAETVLSKVETDVTFTDSIDYYFHYQNYDILSNNVMSSGNVLYSPPYTSASKCEALVVAARDAGQPTPACVNENHAYLLLPRDDNWNVIKWFFRENFDS